MLSIECVTGITFFKLISYSYLVVVLFIPSNIDYYISSKTDAATWYKFKSANRAIH